MHEPGDSALIPIPKTLLEGYGRVWVALHGGSIHVAPWPDGQCFLWENGRGRCESLPDRMYGIAEASIGRGSGRDIPPGVTLNLPPGMRLEGARHTCMTHRMMVGNVGEAWDRLKRVGRQGVKKAERMGCRIASVEDDAYHRLACLKAEALGSPAPPEAMMGAIRAEFGSQLGLTCVTYDEHPVAIVSWVAVGEYGLLMDGASDRAHWDKNPNNLAVWGAIEALVQRGVRCVDYGFSPVGSGDAQFKAHMGGDAVELYQVGPS